MKQIKKKRIHHFQNEDLLDSGLARNELVVTGFRAAALCANVAKAARIYNQVSDKWVFEIYMGNLLVCRGTDL